LKFTLLRRTIESQNWRDGPSSYLPDERLGGCPWWPPGIGQSNCCSPSLTGNPIVAAIVVLGAYGVT